jgi:hypothetical protein
MTDRPDPAMEAAYLSLGRLIAAQCPSGFETASLHMESGETDTRLWIKAVQPDGTQVQLQPGAGAARDIRDSLQAIRDAMAREDGATWRSCVVTLKAGGRFAMDVEY